MFYHFGIDVFTDGISLAIRNESLGKMSRRWEKIGRISVRALHHRRTRSQ